MPRPAPETCRLRLLPDEQQKALLSQACDAHERLLGWLQEHIPEKQPLNLVALHNGWYEKARRHSGLPARSVTLALRDFAARRQGRPVAGLPLDDRLYAVKSVSTLSILTPGGRLIVPFRVAGYEPAGVLEHGGATARLMLENGEFELVAAAAPESSTTRNVKEGLMTATDTVVTRIGRVIAGMTHAAISAAEQASPAAIVEQSVREIDSAADEVRVELGKAMAERHRVSARKDELQREHAELAGKLKAAIDGGRDDLASAGLGRQIDIEAQVVVLDRLLADCDARIGELEEALVAVRASRREAEERLNEFKASNRQDGDGPSGPAAGAVGKALGKVERAQSAAARITGVPAAERSDAASIEELNRLARERAIAERLKKLKGAEH